MATSEATDEGNEVMVIGAHRAALPIRDRRSPDTLLGYDEDGLPR